MDEKLIIELDNDKIKYAVFKINEGLDYKILGKMESVITGKKSGNREFFLYLQSLHDSSPIGHKKILHPLQIHHTP